MKRKNFFQLLLGLFVLLFFVIGSPQVFALTGQWSSNGSSIYYNDGNVGLGVTTPQKKLDIVGGIKISTPPSTPANPTPSPADILFASRGQIKAINTNQMIYLKGPENQIEFRETGSFLFLPGYGVTSNRVTIDSNGNLVVTGGKLDVSNSFTTGTGLLYLKPQNNVNEGGQINFLAPNSYPYFYLDNVSGTFRLVTQDIGATYPESSKFEINNKGDIKIKGKITSDGDICIGNC